jgi:hypothetical protein
MMRTTTRLLGLALATAGALACGPAAAQADAAAPAASATHRHLDPGTPPLAARQAAQAERRAAAQSGGASLNAQAEGQLRASFDAADRTHRGALTQAEAQAGGFGYIARHFDAIDTRHAGEVTFDDVRRYLQSRNARYIAK